MALCPTCNQVMLTERPHRHPTTEAGRSLLADCFSLDGDQVSFPMNPGEAIAAIEAEARARALDDVTRAVEELPASCHAYADDAHPTEAIERRSVIAAIEALR